MPCKEIQTQTDKQIKNISASQVLSDNILQQHFISILTFYWAAAGQLMGHGVVMSRLGFCWRRESVTFPKWFTLVRSPACNFKLSRPLSSTHTAVRRRIGGIQSPNLQDCEGLLKERGPTGEKAPTPCPLFRSSAEDYYPSLVQRAPYLSQ